MASAWEGQGVTETSAAHMEREGRPREEGHDWTLSDTDRLTFPFGKTSSEVFKCAAEGQHQERPALALRQWNRPVIRV